MTNGEKTLLGCGIAVAAALVLSIGGCGFVFYKSFTSFPEQAKRENVYPANKEIIDQVNAIIANEGSFPVIQQKLAAINWPAKVAYVYIEEDKDIAKSNSERTTAPQNAEVFKRYTWSGHSTFTLNGSGHGHIETEKGRKNIVIIDNSQLNAKSENIDYTIYLER